MSISRKPNENRLCTCLLLTLDSQTWHGREVRDTPLRCWSPHRGSSDDSTKQCGSGLSNKCRCKNHIPGQGWGCESAFVYLPVECTAQCSLWAAKLWHSFTFFCLILFRVGLLRHGRPSLPCWLRTVITSWETLSTPLRLSSFAGAHSTFLPFS